MKPNNCALTFKQITGQDPRTHWVTMGTYELAALFKVNPETVRRWRRSGRLLHTGDPVEDFLTILNLYTLRAHLGKVKTRV